MKTRTLIAVATFGMPGLAAAQVHYTATPLPPGQNPTFVPGGNVTASWNTVESGGGVLNAGGFSLLATAGQGVTGTSTAGAFQLIGGFWPGVAETTPCYADCDGSGGSPRLTANDFACFLSHFASGDAYANCDGSTRPPLLTANDFQCYISRFAAGCS